MVMLVSVVMKKNTTQGGISDGPRHAGGKKELAVSFQVVHFDSQKSRKRNNRNSLGYGRLIRLWASGGGDYSRSRD
jgi:hypothetical protein